MTMNFEKVKYDNSKINLRFCLSLCISFVMQVLFVVILQNSLSFRYGMNDDYAMNIMLSGAYGESGGYSVFQNIVLGKIIAFMYVIFPTINWFGIVILGGIALSFIVLCTIIMDRLGFGIGLPASVLAITLFEVRLLYNIQWTYSAFLCIMASIVLLIHASDSKRSKRIVLLVLSGLFFIVGFMIRWNTGLFGGALVLAYGAVKLFEKKKEIIPVIICIASTLVSCVALRVVHNYSYNNNAGWQDYMEYNEVRSELLDFSRPEYDSNIELYKSVGWSENDYNLFSRFVIPDEEKFSTENLQAIAAANKGNKYTTDVSSLFEIVKMGLRDYTSVKTAVWFLVIAFVLCIIFNKNKLLPIGLLIAPLAMHITLAVMNRAIDRAVYPIYLVASLVMMVLISPKFVQSLTKWIKSVKIRGIISLVLVVCVLVFSVANIKKQLVPVRERYLGGNSTIALMDDYVRQHKENVYVIAPNNISPRNQYYTIFKVPEVNSLENFFPAGGWEQRTKYYNDFKKKNGIENIFRDLVTKDNYYIVALDYVDVIKIYMEENYNIDVEMKMVDTVGAFEIYKVVVK